MPFAATSCSVPRWVQAWNSGLRRTVSRCPSSARLLIGIQRGHCGRRQAGVNRQRIRDGGASANDASIAVSSACRQNRLTQTLRAAPNELNILSRRCRPSAAQIATRDVGTPTVDRSKQGEGVVEGGREAVFCRPQTVRQDITPRHAPRAKALSAQGKKPHAKAQLACRRPSQVTENANVCACRVR